MADETMPHLTPIEPAEAVHAFCDKLLSRETLPYHIRLEAQAFRETRTPHDGRRLQNSLRADPHFTVQAADLGLLLTPEGGQD